MANPYILRSIGGGALAGGAAGAATGDRDQTVNQRLGRGILGAMGGSVLGGTAHAGLRYNALKKMTTPEIAEGKVVQKALGKERVLNEAVFGSDSVKAFANQAKKNTDALKDQIGEGLTEAQYAAREEAKRAQEAANAFDSSNMFHGMDASAAREKYKKEVRLYHPDAAPSGITEADRAARSAKYDEINKQYKQFEEASLMKKSASTLMFENCFYYLRNTLY